MIASLYGWLVMVDFHLWNGKWFLMGFFLVDICLIFNPHIVEVVIRNQTTSFAPLFLVTANRKRKTKEVTMATYMFNDARANQIIREK